MTNASTELFFNRSLAETDPEIFGAIGKEAAGAAAALVEAAAGAAGTAAIGAAAPPPPPHATAAPMTAIAATVLFQIMAPPASSRPA